MMHNITPSAFNAQIDGTLDGAKGIFRVVET